MVSKSTSQRFYLITGILSWVALILLDVFSVSVFYPLTIHFVRTLFLNFFLLSIFLSYKHIISNEEGSGFNELLWKLSVTGFVVIVILTGVHLISNYTIDILPQYFEVINDLVYHVIIVVVSIFISSCFFVFKRMILYQKSKGMLNLWLIYESMLYLSLLINFLELSNKDVLFQLSIIPILVMGIVLALNLKWIAYLNVKQKWNSIIYILIILGLNSILLWNLFGYSFGYEHSTGLSNTVFILSLVAFISVYCLFSLLVLIFNLPTSSVFEKKFGEVLNIQRLSKSVQVGKTEDEVYKLLIESSMGTLMAVSGVLEILDENKNPKNIIYRDFDKDSFYSIKTFLRKSNTRGNEEYLLIEDLKGTKFYKDIDQYGIESLLIIPLISYNEKLGTLYLFSEIKGGFEKEMIEIVNTYVYQACTSISNFRLIHQAVKNARYVEELEIAKRVQSSLLPKKLINNQYIEMAAVSISADEVGGDYYDYAQVSDNKYNIVIGDVSGKGTSAAFHMAKLKGVFHSLAQLDLPSDRFTEYANSALSACLDKTSFVTLTVLMLDLEKKMLETSRAGHCPTLFYDTAYKKSRFFQQEGLGLGIIRNQDYHDKVYKETIDLKTNDIILIYTDGIPEATNIEGEEFGYERIRLFLDQYYQLDTEAIKILFLETLRIFCGDEKIDDDYSLMVIKIK